MTDWRLWVGSVFLYALLLVGTAPASLLDAALAASTNGRMRVTNVTGTLWTGEGQIEIRTAANGAVLQRSLNWQLKPGQLLLARLVWQFGLTGKAPSSVLIARWSGFEISGVDFSLPASAMAQVHPALSDYGLSGTMNLHIDTLAFGTANTSGSAIMQWQGAGTALSPVAPLGNYELRLEGAGAEIIMTLRTLQGPLQLEGKGHLGNDSAVDFSVVARVAPQASQQLAPFLRLFAVESNDGSFYLQFR